MTARILAVASSRCSSAIWDSTLPGLRTACARLFRIRPGKISRVRPAVPANNTRRKAPHPKVLSAEQLHDKSSNTLAHIETCWLALRALVDIPKVGTVCSSLELGVNALTETHEALELFLDSVKS
jgi:hypothetical protein